MLRYTTILIIKMCIERSIKVLISIGLSIYKLCLFPASKVDYTNYDCFLLIVLSHGDKGVLYARDNGYKPESVWGPFTADNAPTLAGKPKMFFIQACQGDQLDRGVTLSRTETDGSPHSYRIPT
ncbi:Peptidase, partial [Oryctes borbonicus]